MFKFKTPSKKARETMAKVASGEIDGTNFEERCIEKIKKLTCHDEVKITSSGNNSIFIALSAIKGDIIIPDQGGWHGFKQIAKFLNKNIITLKTDFGLIDPEDIDGLDIKEDSALIYTSFAGYCAEQDAKSISKYCRNNGIISIEDASAGIGDSENRLGKHSDIILASTGSPKIINVGSGGFIAGNDEEIFKNTSMPQKLSKASEIICGGMDCELDNAEENLQLTLDATDYIKKHLTNTLHPGKRGINIIIPHEDAKSVGWNLKQNLKTDKSGFITTCPNYNRVKAKAIAIEIKNLDYRCLEKENLDKIIEEIEINNLQ